MRLTGLRQADYGWLAVAAVVVVAEITAAEGEMLSHGTARYRRAHPVLTTSMVLTTAMHLLDVLPCCVDPFHQVFRLIRRLKIIVVRV